MHDLIDIGANLAHDSFDDDRNAVLERAHAEGVARIVITGSCHESNRKAATLAANSGGALFSTAGVHPHHAADYDAAAERRIVELAESGAIVAVGECGLDYFRNFSPREAQLAAFDAQLDLAISSGLPAFLHQRDAHDDFIDRLDRKRADITRAVAHCFTGVREELEAYIAMDLYVGITGWICDERRGAHLLDIVGLIPDDRLLVETDAPYLLPRTIRPRPRSRRNEPMYLTQVVTAVAAARGQTAGEVARLTTANAERFFALPRR